MLGLLPPSSSRQLTSRCPARAAIARPARFYRALADRGWDVRREITFRDHHWFSPGDVARIEAIAREVDADLILTTEKDAVRLDALVSGPLWAFLPMTVAIEPAALFSDWLLARLNAARANRQAEAAREAIAALRQAL